MNQITAAARVPVNLTQYQLGRSLGEGGYGRVFEAWDVRLQRNVAIKQLKAPPPAGQSGLIDEARHAASLRHGAFVKIYTFEDDGDTQSIVMELVHGGTLRQLLPELMRDPGKALDIAAQVAAAMAEAHAAGMVHGDLKPSNLMLEPSGTVRILDFGLARQVDPLATQSLAQDDTLGTIAYMAPERLTGNPLQASSDIYALGVVLYELATGARPLADLHGLALAAAHLQSNSDQWLFQPGTDPRLMALIRAMTARDLTRRLPSMRHVAERIAQLRDAESMPWAPMRHAPPRRRRIRLAAGAAGAVLIGALTLAATTLPAPDYRAWLTPYTEAGAMQAGMAALRMADREGELDKATRAFNQILEHEPRHAAAAAGLSVAYSLRYIGDDRDETWLGKAAAGAQLAVRENDQLALAHAALAWVLALQGHGDAALAAAERALRLDPGDLLALYAKANILLRMRRHDDARQLIADAEHRFPGVNLFADLAGTLRFQRGDYAGAEQAFRRSLRLEPGGTQAYANLSAALLRQNRGDEALQVLQRGLQIRPSGSLYSNLGTALFARGDYAGAANAFTHAVSAAKGGPNDYLRWANLADTLRWLPGREREGRQAYLRAAQLLKPLLARQPDDPTFVTRMAVYAAHLDDPAAPDQADRGARLAPDNPDAHFRAALANELGGRRAAALAHLTRAQALGYPSTLIESEPDFIALRRDPRYPTLTMDSSK